MFIAYRSLNKSIRLLLKFTNDRKRQREIKTLPVESYSSDTDLSSMSPCLSYVFNMLIFETLWQNTRHKIHCVHFHVSVSLSYKIITSTRFKAYMCASAEDKMYLDCCATISRIFSSSTLKFCTQWSVTPPTPP